MLIKNIAGKTVDAAWSDSGLTMWIHVDDKPVFNFSSQNEVQEFNQFVRRIISRSNEDISMKITKKQLRNIIAEALELDIEKGDVILTGRFKNKRTIVKKISTDDLGQPTVNGMKALSFRVEKLMPKSKWSKKTLAELEEDEE